METISFSLFVILWNQRQGQATPRLHLRIARWLEHCQAQDQARLLLMAFRGGGKSTVAGLFAAWLLYRQPDLRILVLAADEILARKMVRQVRRIIERHPMTPHLRPETPDQWAGERFTVRRSLELRDPSMLARGIEANITGSRADVVICDDVEVPNTSDTAEKRQDLRERLSEISYVLVPGGTQLYIGTPHSHDTIYAQETVAGGSDARPFLEGFARLEIPVLTPDGESAWADKFSPAHIETIRLQNGPNKFASQMMLQPRNITEGYLSPELLQVYDDTLDYVRELKSLYLGPRVLAAASAWWDPAFGNGGDDSVLACVFCDETGQYYVHHLEYIKIDKHDPQDEAGQQCAAVARALKELRMPSVTVEINGLGRFLPALLRNELARTKVPCSVVEFSNRRPKDVRILEAFDALLAARRLHIHASLLRSPFIREMREWRPGMRRGRDDGLDAVAGALSQMPVRLKRHYGSGAQEWMRGGGAQKAKTEFEV